MLLRHFYARFYLKQRSQLLTYKVGYGNACFSMPVLYGQLLNVHSSKIHFKAQPEGVSIEINDALYVSLSEVLYFKNIFRPNQGSSRHVK